MKTQSMIERKLKQLKDEYNSSIKTIYNIETLHTMLARIETLEWVLDKQK